MQDNQRAPTSPFLKKVENYWYHYKWHTIIGAILLITLLVCTLQMCQKPVYDTELIYAGPHSITQVEQGDIKATLASFMKDADGNGQLEVNLIQYWVNDNVAEDEEADKSNVPLLQQNSMQNKQSFHDEISAGDVVIYLVSKDLFLEMMERGCLYDLKALIPDLSDGVLTTDKDGARTSYGVTLSALPLGSLAGLSALPADTVLCMQDVRYLNQIFNKDKTEAQHAYCRELMTALLSFTKN
jgi:hypothetical protein